MDKTPAQTRPPGRELFFAPLEVVFDPTTCEQIGFAYSVSKYGHARQTRDDGTRYFDHPKAAAWIYINELQGTRAGLDAKIIIDILLHDLCEDTHLLSPYRIAHNFGVDCALDVRALTKLPKGMETTEDYLKRVVSRGPRTILAKLCDRLHNLRSLTSTSAEKRERTLNETREYHLPILTQALRECGTEGSYWDVLASIVDIKFKEAFTWY